MFRRVQLEKSSAEGSSPPPLHGCSDVTESTFLAQIAVTFFCNQGRGDPPNVHRVDLVFSVNGMLELLFAKDRPA